MTDTPNSESEQPKVDTWMESLGFFRSYGTAWMHNAMGGDILPRQAEFFYDALHQQLEAKTTKGRNYCEMHALHHDGEDCPDCVRALGDSRLYTQVELEAKVAEALDEVYAEADKLFSVKTVSANLDFERGWDDCNKDWKKSLDTVRSHLTSTTNNTETK